MTDMTTVMDGPYTHGYFTSCECGWTSLECSTPGASNVALSQHLRDDHPIATIDRP